MSKDRHVTMEKNNAKNIICGNTNCVSGSYNDNLIHKDTQRKILLQHRHNGGIPKNRVGRGQNSDTERTPVGTVGEYILKDIPEVWHDREGFEGIMH